MALRDISAWSIRNPVIPLVFFTGLLFAGIVSFLRMDVTNNPDVDFPAVIVNIAQPGASPTEIENQITQRVESALRSIAGVNSIQSTAREGSSQTFVEFEIGTDLIEAVNEVETAIDSVRGSLPDGILEPRVQKVNVVGEPIGYVGVEADDMTLEQLSWFVDDTVAKRLLKVPGMAEVQRIGGVDRQIEVILDPARMQSFGVTASQINVALRQSNLDAAGASPKSAAPASRCACSAIPTRPLPCRRPRSRSAAAAPCASPTLPPCATAIPNAPRSARWAARRSSTS